METLYLQAVQAAKAAETEEEYREAAKAFQRISDYSDAELQAERCLEKAEVYQNALKYLPGDNTIRLHSVPYEKALEDLESIRPWRDTDELIEKSRARIAQIQAEEARKKAVSEAVLRRKKNRRLILWLSGPVLAAAVAVFLFLLLPGINLLRAKAMIREGQYREAYRLLKKNKRDESQELLSELVPLYRESMLTQAEVGSYLVLGSYEQDNNSYNGDELIEWLVAAKEEDRILLVSRYALDCYPYEDSSSTATWESSSLRGWLNSEFCETAYENPRHSTEAGRDTTDRIFLLSISEALEYFETNEARKCEPTNYARSFYAFKANDGSCWYWLRTPGGSPNRAACVIGGGYVSYGGEVIDDYRCCVRPAMWIGLQN